MSDEELPPGSSRKTNIFQYLFRLISCEGWFVAFTVLAAFIIRFYIAYALSYWVDEIVMIDVGKGSTISVINFLITDTAQGPFSWLIIHGLVRFSQVEWFLRLFQVLAGSLAVYYAYFLMRDTMGRRAGLIAAVLLALSLNGINYSTDCRYYSYLVLFSLAMAHHYQAALSTGLKRHYILFGVATLLNIYNGHFAFFLGLIIVIHMIGTIIVRIFKKPVVIPFSRFVYISLAGVAALLLYLPWLGVMLSFFTGPWGIAGGNFSGEATGGTTLDKLLILIGGRFGIGSFSHPESDWHSFIFPALFLLMWIQGKKGLGNRFFILLWLVLPLYVLLSVQARHYFTIRYFMIIFPALLLGAAGGIDRIWTLIVLIAKKVFARPVSLSATPLLKIAPLVTAFAIIIISWSYLYDVIQYPKQDWKRSVAYIKEHAKEDDVLFLNSGDEIGFYYYLNPYETGLRVETRDDALPWICAGKKDVWLVSHYFENNSILFQKWVRSNMELVKIMPGTMIPVYIFRFHRPEPVVNTTHIVWYPVLAEPGDLNVKAYELGDKIALSPFMFPPNKGVMLGWLSNLTGNCIARIHCTSVPDQNTCKLAAYDGNGVFISQQQNLWPDNLTPTLLWQKRNALPVGLQLETGNNAFAVKSTEITQAQSLGPLEGINIDSGREFTQRLFVTEAGVWQILLGIENNLGANLNMTIDGEPVALQDLGDEIWQAEAGLAWGTHVLTLKASVAMHINWITVAHELFPKQELSTSGRKLIKRIDNLAAGDYLLAVKANARKGNHINPMGWLEVFDAERRLTLYRMLLTNSPLNVPELNYFKPGFYSGFPDANTANVDYKANGMSNFHIAFRAMDGPVEVYYTELAPGGVDWYDMELIPFASTPETKELLDESAEEFFRGAVDFHHNVGELDSSKGKPELYIDGEGKADYLAWGFTCDVPEGAYLLRADISEESGNFILDNLNDIGGIMEKSAGEKEIFSVVHGMLTLEARVFWQGKGPLRLRSIRKENLAGPLDVGVLFKRVEQYYKKNKRGFNLRDVKELQFDKMVKVFP